MSALQATLPIGEYVAPVFDRPLSIAERFTLFHNANPWVADAIEHLAIEWLNAGHTKVGVKALAEVVRWQYGRTQTDHFKLNNSYVSHYARLLLERHPEWPIELRELRAA